MKQGVYEEIINREIKQELLTLDEDTYAIEKEDLDVEEARKFLAAYISNVTRKALNYVRGSERNDKEALQKQIAACNRVISTLSHELDDDAFSRLEIDEAGEVLQAVHSKLNDVRSIQKETTVRRPVTSIAQSSLFTGSTQEPSMLHELKKEILSCDEIDFLVSFVKWSGIRVIMDELRTFTERGGKLRVITTSYMEATEFKAVMEVARSEICY